MMILCEAQLAIPTYALYYHISFSILQTIHQLHVFDDTTVSFYFNILFLQGAILLPTSSVCLSLSLSTIIIRIIITTTSERDFERINTPTPLRHPQRAFCLLVYFSYM